MKMLPKEAFKEITKWMREDGYVEISLRRVNKGIVEEIKISVKERAYSASYPPIELGSSEEISV
jgi:hypothetical protein